MNCAAPTRCASDGVNCARPGCDFYRLLLVTHDRLLAALHEKHAATGFCPLCDAGPPPYHNPGCLVAPGPEYSEGRPEGRPS